jgi:hypothetical protein
MPAAYLKGSVDAGIPTYRRASPGCTGKVQFDSAAIAARAARRKKHRTVYRCTLCNAWHVGADTPEPARKVKVALIRREAE